MTTLTSSNTTPRRGSKQGISRTTVLVVIASETAFFGTLLMSYLYLRTGQADWPFAHPSLPRLVVPGINTLILIASAVVAWSAQRASGRGDRPALKFRLMLSLALGLVFIAGQVFEFTRTGMRPDDLAFGGVFFALMGFHGLHVLAGQILNGMSAYRLEQGALDDGLRASIEAGVWFWTYVVAVWIVLFAALYVV
jgi:heme/copper-type cytochrome/quinol oxidase subunit 3